MQITISYENHFKFFCCCAIPGVFLHLFERQIKIASRPIYTSEYSVDW